MISRSTIQSGQIVGAGTTGVSVTKTAGMFGVSRSTASKLMTAFEKERRNFLVEIKTLRKKTQTLRRGPLNAYTNC